jgi:hypothetical protein
MNKNKLLKHIDFWAERLGSYSAVAAKCKISDAALSTLRAGKYGANEGLLLNKIASGLDFKDKKWVTVRTIGNYKRVLQVFNDARDQMMWIRISERAGAGKSEALEDLYNQDNTGSVVLIECEEWSPKQFLMKIVEKIGLSDKAKYYHSQAVLLDLICGYFNSIAHLSPILLIDQFDKLKPSAKRQLIPLYNKTEDNLALIAAAPESLEIEIERGIRLRKAGYDEIDSRFGRSVVTLKGASEKDIYAICEANGLDDRETIAHIWNSMPKVDKPTLVKTPGGHKEVLLPYVEDLRRLKTLIKSGKLKVKRVA